jgi:multidrug resistance protein, MATE family
MNSIYTFKSVYFELCRSMRISLPLICSQLIYALSCIIATMMISHLGRDELATNVLVWGVYIALISISFGVLSAVGVMVAQSYGANDSKSIRITIAQGLILAFVFAIPMALIIWFSPYVLYWTGQEPNIIKLSIPYFHSLAWCMLPLNILLVMEQFLIGIAITRLVLFLSILRVPLEIFLFYVLFFGKWGFPKLGLVGIAYGMTISISMALIVLGCYFYLSSKCRNYRISFKFLQINKKYFLELIRVGWPLGGMYSLEMALFATVALMMGRFGSEMLAAHQIAYQCLVFTLAIIFGVSQGTMVRVGHEVGRNNKPALKLATYVSMGIGFCFMLIITAFYIYFPDYIIAFGVNVYAVENQALIKHTTMFLMLAGILQLTDCFRLITSGALRGLKDTKMSMYITTISLWLIAFPSSYLLAFVLKMGGVGIWWGLIVGLAVSAIVLIIRFNHVVNLVDLNTLVIR